MVSSGLNFYQPDFGSVGWYFFLNPIESDSCLALMCTISNIPYKTILNCRTCSWNIFSDSRRITRSSIVTLKALKIIVSSNELVQSKSSLNISWEASLALMFYYLYCKETRPSPLLECGEQAISYNIRCILLLSMEWSPRKA